MFYLCKSKQWNFHTPLDCNKLIMLGQANQGTRSKEAMLKTMKSSVSTVLIRHMKVRCIQDQIQFSVPYPGKEIKFKPLLKWVIPSKTSQVSLIVVKAKDISDREAKVSIEAAWSSWIQLLLLNLILMLQLPMPKSKISKECFSVKSSWIRKASKLRILIATRKVQAMSQERDKENR